MTSGGEAANTFSIDTFRMANRITKFFEKLSVTGGRFGDFLRAEFGVTLHGDIHEPEYLGGTYGFIGADEVIQSTGYGNTDSALGELAGRGVGSMTGGTRLFRATEPGYIVGMFSITPMVDYCQGISPVLSRVDPLSFYYPDFDRIGFQPKMASELCALNALDSDGNPIIWGEETAGGVLASPMDISVGYQPAWADYTSRVNKVSGEFVNSLNYWTLTREYRRPSAVSGSINNYDFSQYVVPGHTNVPFGDTSGMTDAFQVQLGFDVQVNRKISKRVMPTL